MVQFATAEELGAYIGRPVEPEQRASFELKLQIASASIQAKCAQALALVIDDEVVLRSQRGPELKLPERPILDVASVTLDGVDVGDLTWTRAGTVSWPGSGMISPTVWSLRSLVGTSKWSPEIRVTYSHGYAIDALPDPNPLGVEFLPEELKGLCLAAAARSLVNPTGASAETIGSYSVTYADSRFSEDELDILHRYRRTVFS